MYPFDLTQTLPSSGPQVRFERRSRPAGMRRPHPPGISYGRFAHDSLAKGPSANRRLAVQSSAVGRGMGMLVLTAIACVAATGPSIVLAQGYRSEATTLFGIPGNGSRFVYVVDTSGSTAGIPLRIAKRELLRSLDGLSRTQQFQIVFYNHRPRVYRTGGHTGLYWADKASRQGAKNFVDRVRAEGGTDHMAAISTALQMRPGVIFFFTDADEPRLSEHDLGRIERLNGTAVIHVVEFGHGEQDAAASVPLQKLATQNRGQYRYLDVDSYDESKSVSRDAKGNPEEAP